MTRYKFYEHTSDHGYKKTAYASNNRAEYILTSAMAHDMYNEYLWKFGRHPHSSWFHRHFSFDCYREQD